MVSFLISMMMHRKFPRYHCDDISATVRKGSTKKTEINVFLLLLDFCHICDVIIKLYIKERQVFYSGNDHKKYSCQYMFVLALKSNIKRMEVNALLFLSLLNFVIYMIRTYNYYVEKMVRFFMLNDHKKETLYILLRLYICHCTQM